MGQGVAVPVEPFCGVMGTALDEPGAHSTISSDEPVTSSPPSMTSRPVATRPKSMRGANTTSTSPRPLMTRTRSLQPGSDAGRPSGQLR